MASNHPWSSAMARPAALSPSGRLQGHRVPPIAVRALLGPMHGQGDRTTLAEDAETRLTAAGRAIERSRHGLSVLDGAHRLPTDVEDEIARSEARCLGRRTGDDLDDEVSVTAREHAAVLGR